MGRLCQLTTSPETGTAVLEVTTEALGMPDRAEFLAGCQDLMASDQKRLVLDLHSVRRIFSMFMGTIVDLSDRARRNGQSLTVKASPPAADLMRSVLGTRFLDIDDGRVVEERGKKQKESTSPPAQG